MDNSLANKHPELISEWSEKNYPITPDTVTFGSNKVMWWKGSCGHEWQASIKARSSGENCPICSGARVAQGINDLATLKPTIAAEWSDKNKELKPTMVTVGSSKKVIWKGACGHEWVASIKSRTVNGTGCPYCSHNTILEGFNDLASQMPEVAAEWSDKNYPLMPNQVTVFANRKVWWKCKNCGYEWNTLISTRSGGSKCPCCSGLVLVRGENDFATTQPLLTKEWSERNYPLTAHLVNEKSRKNVWWRCRECGNEWQSVVAARVKGTKCPVCADRSVLTGYNDLATTDPYLLSEWDYEKNIGVFPDKISRQSKQSVWWRCSFGHSWKAKIADRVIEGKSCLVCEKEFQSAFPKLLLMYYAGQKKMQVKMNYADIIGIPLEMYIPDERVAIETYNGGDEIENLKKHLCKKQRLKLLKVPYSIGNDEVTFACKMKAALRSAHIFITSDETEDTEYIKKSYYEWKSKQAARRTL